MLCNKLNKSCVHIDSRVMCFANKQWRYSMGSGVNRHGHAHDAWRWFVLRRPGAQQTVVSMIGLSFLAFALASLQWVLFGYSLSFGSDISGIIGGLDFLALSGVGLGEAPLAANLPHLVYVAFQLVFAAVTLAILTLPWLKGFASAPS